MKPMGLTDPRTGRRPYAVVQLRQENLRAQSFNLVGFQNHMRFGEQARVLRLIPGLENAEFLRFGQIHRNTYINAPALLTPTLQLRTRPEVFFAGQISGVEGYVESIATGLMAGIHAAALATGRSAARLAARNRARIALPLHLRRRSAHYQPANITFDLLPQLDDATRQRLRRDKQRAPRRGLPARAAKRSKSTAKSMSDLRRQIERTGDELKRAKAPRRTRCATIRATWRSSCDYFRLRKSRRPSRPPSICSLLREWLARSTSSG